MTFPPLAIDVEENVEEKTRVGLRVNLLYQSSVNMAVVMKLSISFNADSVIRRLRER